MEVEVEVEVRVDTIYVTVVGPAPPSLPDSVIDVSQAPYTQGPGYSCIFSDRWDLAKCI